MGISLNDVDGLRRLYAPIAGVLQCDAPSRDFAQLALDLTLKGSEPRTSKQAIEELGADRDDRRRLSEALGSPKYKWRTLQRVAIEAGYPKNGRRTSSALTPAFGTARVNLKE